MDAFASDQKKPEEKVKKDTTSTLKFSVDKVSFEDIKMNNFNNDTQQILKSLDLPVTQENIEKISPWRFTAPVSPDMAARKENLEIVEEIKGQDLIGLEYEPIFDFYAKDESLKNKENGWKVYAADFVTAEEGTGIVHIAPAFGENDMELGKRENLPFHSGISL